MPAIASLEDLKAAQKDLCYSMRVCLKRPARRSGFAQAGAILKGIYSMRYALCALRFSVYWLWLGERTPEQLKGEGGD
jgi:hypothetical protein